MRKSYALDAAYAGLRLTLATTRSNYAQVVVLSGIKSFATASRFVFRTTAILMNRIIRWNRVFWYYPG